MNRDLAAEIGKAIPSLARSASPVDQITYARDLWPRHHLAVREGRIAEHAPGAIVWPTTSGEVAAVVGFCAKEGVPMVPFGAGSGVCGGILPDHRVLVVDLKRMRRWRSLDREGATLDVEAGALGITLEEDLNREGFTLGHFPSSILCSTVGGWVAARSAGQCSGRYGKIEDMVASLECVIGRGEVVRLERRIHGPDLTPLMIGSEGVLGVVTSAKLRLHPVPASRAFGAFSFPSVEAGCAALRDMFQGGLRPAIARLYDAFDSMIARRGAGKRGRGASAPASMDRGHAAPHQSPGRGAMALRTLLRAPAVLNRIVDAVGDRLLGGATLILIFEGNARENAVDLRRATAITERHGAKPLGQAPARHWLEHRYGVSYRQAPVFMAGAFCDTMEVAASWSRLADLYKAVRSALGRHVFVMAHLSHAYPDGCSIYFTFAGSTSSTAEAEAKYDAAWSAALDAAISAGGTLSHHHGVGRSKAPKLGAELGLGVDVIGTLRGVLDPAGIMNPGNLLPRAPRASKGLPDVQGMARTARRRATEPPAEPRIDRASLLIHVAGSATLAEIEATIATSGLSLGLSADAPSWKTTVAEWIAGGAFGAPDGWNDPVDHLVAGFTARLLSGADLEVHPAPRRAVGPDLFALFLGMQDRVGTITSAHLRIHGPDRSRPMPTSIARDPPVSEAEAAWLDRIARATARVA